MKKISVLLILVMLMTLTASCKSNDRPPAHNLGNHVIAYADYPARVKYPTADTDDRQSWIDEQVTLRDTYYRDDLNIDAFVKSITPTLVNTDDNTVFSPLGMYIALGMLAETTDGNSRAEILNMLSVPDIETLRDNVQRLWNLHFSDDGRTKLLLSNSLWLDDFINYNKPALENISKNYYASAFSGDVSSADYAKMASDWVNEQTDGVLGEGSAVAMNPNTVFTLLSTVYFKAGWGSAFDKINNTNATFHGANGDTLCEFMTSREMEYYQTDSFKATRKFLMGMNNMYFILPDEGTDVNALLKGDDLYSFLADTEKYRGNFETNLTVPKFDISTDTDISDALKSLGVEDVFDSDKSDYTPITDTDGVFLETAAQSTRLLIDEEGCLAASKVQLSSATKGEPPEIKDLTLDRPFIFVVMSESDVPVFIGTVNNPN